MKFQSRAGLLCVATSVALVLTLAPPGAARPAIRGKLSEPGYTVIALTSGGKATSVRAGTRTFKLRPPGAAVTLHLRGADGVYAGPLVARDEGTRAIVGVRAGAKLGAIEVVPATGYARTTTKQGKRELDRTRTARAKDGVPIGAGVFGRVRAKPKRGAVPGDLDIDGIPDRADIDDDGDRVLDKVDRTPRASKAQSPGHQDPFDLASALGAVPLEDTANVNAGSTDEQIAAVLPLFGFLSTSAPDADSVELDCGGTANPSPPPPLVGGLSYCSYGGTGRVELPAPRNVFPECCDPDRDGWGELEPRVVGPDFVAFHLDHGATSSQMGTGDTLILRITEDGRETQLTDTQQFIFATTPALVSYVDEAGNGRSSRTRSRRAGRGPTAMGFPSPTGPTPTRTRKSRSRSGRPSGVRRRPAVRAAARPGLHAERVDRRRRLGLRSGQPPGAGEDLRLWLVHAGRPLELRPEPLGGLPGPAGRRLQGPSTLPAANPAHTFSYRLNLTRCLRAFDISFAPGATEGFHFQAFTPIPAGAGRGRQHGGAGLLQASVSGHDARR